jgi:hypothetical protein
MRRKFLAAVIVALGMVTAHAADEGYEYPYLAFQAADGTVQTVAVESLTITFTDGKLVATSNGTVLNLTLADLSKMYFTTTEGEADAIAKIAASNVPVEVYTVAGVKQGQYENFNAARAALQKGVYIIKSDNLTSKIAVK